MSTPPTLHRSMALLYLFIPTGVSTKYSAQLASTHEKLAAQNNCRYVVVDRIWMHRPPICDLKNTDGWKKIWLIFGLAELLRKLKSSAKIQLITNDFGRAVEPKLKWLPTWMMYLLLSSVSLISQNLPASICIHKKFRTHENYSFQIRR